MDPDGFGAAAENPPYAAQVPTVSVAMAARPKRSTHSSIGTGFPPSDPRWPYAPFAFVGTAPSTIKTNFPAYSFAAAVAAASDSAPVAAISVP